MRRAYEKKDRAPREDKKITEVVGKLVSKAMEAQKDTAGNKRLTAPKTKVRSVIRKLLGAPVRKEFKQTSPLEEIVKDPHALKKTAEKYGVSEASIEDLYKRIRKLEDTMVPGTRPEDIVAMRSELVSMKSMPDFTRLGDVEEIRQSLFSIEGRISDAAGGIENKLQEAEIERDSIIKSKEEIEKKYYKRELDESAFKKMMQDYEQKLIQTEEKIKRYKEESSRAGAPEQRTPFNMNKVFNKYAKGYKAVYFPVYAQSMAGQGQPVETRHAQQLQAITGAQTMVPKSAIDGVAIPQNEPKSKLMDTEEETENAMGINVIYPLIPRKPEKGEMVYAYTNIKWDKDDNVLVYNVFEPVLTADEKHTLSKAKEILEERLNIDLRKLRKAEAVSYLMRQTDDVFSVMGARLDPKRADVLKYYIRRDFAGLERIEPLMNDPNIEDVSCDGMNIPIYVFHRNPLIGSIRTNIKFVDQKSLDTFAIRLAQRAGKTISVAEPLLDGTLTDGSRVQATLGTDIARRGSNFTIRKFTDIPLTPIDMINYGTINAEALAYLWIAVENGKSVLIGGSTASGKTTLLNVLSLFIKPNKKIVSIEDSVAGNCEIVINRNGCFEKTTIGKLIDGQINVNKSEKDCFGREYCTTNPENVEVFSMTGSGKMKLSRVSSFIRHYAAKDMWEITTRAGRRIKVTGDHSLFSVDENGGIVPTEVRTLAEGSFIATPRLLPWTNARLEKINVLDKARNLNGIFVRGEPLKSIPVHELEKADATGWHVKNCLNNGMLPVEIFSKLPRSENPEQLKGLYIKAGRGGNEIKADMELTPELLALVGLWLADGCYDKNSVLVPVANDSECRDTVVRAASQLGLECKNHSDGITMMINSAAFKGAAMGALDMKGDACTKKMPDWAFNLDENQAACLLRGYFSGDGCVSKDEIGASSSSLQLIRDIHTLLLRFGIMSRFKNRMKQRDKTYRVRISGAGNLKIFAEKIGFLQGYKQTKLLERCKVTSAHATTDIIPVPQQFLQKLAEEAGSFKLNNYLHGSNMGRPSMANASLACFGEATEQAKQLAVSDLFWDEVAEIRNLGKTGLFVYDLSVPDCENFVCENIVAHNTPELKLPHPHWVPEVARTAISETEGKKIGEVDMFDLLKESLRQRPDYIVVGEVRGREAYVLFQQIASGHPGMSTIHADSLTRLVDRLTTPPINLPGNLIQNLDILIFIDTTSFKNRNARKIDTITEVLGYENGAPVGNVVFKWEPTKMFLKVSGKSSVLRKIAYSSNMSEKAMQAEVLNRVKILEWMRERNISDFASVAKIFSIYNSDPEKVLNMID